MPSTTWMDIKTKVPFLPFLIIRKFYAKSPQKVAKHIHQTMPTVKDIGKQ